MKAFSDVQILVYFLHVSSLVLVKNCGVKHYDKRSCHSVDPTPVYVSQLQWQDASIQSLLFQTLTMSLLLLLYLSDSNCVKMMELGVVPYILDLLEQHVDEGDVSVQHAGLSALRNLAIPGTEQITEHCKNIEFITDDSYIILLNSTFFSAVNPDQYSE